MSIEEQLAALEATVSRQADLITTLQNELAAAKKVTDAVGPYLSVDSGNNICLTGANLHIRSGSGKTDGTVNGLGNLIVGYNEKGAMNIRTGSHNLVIGVEHSYSSYGGLVAGMNNSIFGEYSSVSGGWRNTANGHVSSVSGGAMNTASKDASSVSGGVQNTASGLSSSVSGGDGNTASGNHSSVSGGRSNIASGNDSSVSGGGAQRADAEYSYAPYP